MTFSPKKIIYLAVTNYLSEAECEKLIAEIIGRKTLTDSIFLKIVRKYFDFNRFKDEPFLEVDIWLFNYLMYQLKVKDNFNPLNAGEEISLKGKLPRKGLIVKYENQIILPQYELLKEAHKILND